MATWSDLATYVRDTYTINEDDGDVLSMVFGTGGGRSQIVLLSRAQLMDGDEEWVILNSPIGPADEVNLRAALAHVGDMVCGGLSLAGDKWASLRHAVPLANLDINEFERPLALVTSSADHLERLLVGGDRF